MMHFNLYSRNEFHRLINLRCPGGIGVEVGVGSGEYSEYLLQNSSLKILYSVDAWDENFKSCPAEFFVVPQYQLDKFHEEAIKRLSKFGDRNSILHTTSLNAVNMFDDKSLDFIYIDAAHEYEEVKMDLKCWYPKLKKGGIFAGHDYVDELKLETNDPFDRLSVTRITTYKMCKGVVNAVREFANEHKLRILKTNESIPSWILN